MSVHLYKNGPNGWEPDTEHELFRMPAGEWHVKGHPFNRADYLALVRGSSADDLIAVAIWADAVHRARGVTHLVIPYFPGARQDRTHPGEALSVKVYADLINAQGHETVTILDPHSIVTPALIDRCVVHDGVEQATMALITRQFDGIIIPDLGAVKRSTALAEVLGLPTYQATKKRDPSTGKLSGFSIDLPTDGHYLIADDIIDGGGTFMGLSSAVYADELHDRVELSLYATHGVFSGAAWQLDKYFYEIHTTDSIRTENLDECSYDTFIIHPVVQTIFPT